MSDDLLLICSGCGARAVLPPEDWEGQRQFRGTHSPPCVYGSNGEPWKHAKK